jgi:hypothetical protein
MPNLSTLEFFFSTVATIVASLTGLIGVFATFRLQNISAEIRHLKQSILEKKIEDLKTLNDYIKGENYHLLEKIYERNFSGIDILKSAIEQNELHLKINEFAFDLENLSNNQHLYQKIKVMTVTIFVICLAFVFANLGFLLFASSILLLPNFGALATFYFVGLAFIFLQFVWQVYEMTH